MHFTFCYCYSNRSNRYTCLLHGFTLCCLPLRRGDIKVFACVTPFSDDGSLPVMCESHFVRVCHFASTIMTALAITCFTVT